MTTTTLRGAWIAGICMAVPKNAGIADLEGHFGVKWSGGTCATKMGSPVLSPIQEVSAL
jgi:hypothetical protein